MDRLRDVNVRPNVGGKKAPGALELHVNGLRFQASRGERLDLPFKNIKIAFYQPAEKEILVSVHVDRAYACMPHPDAHVFVTDDPQHRARS